MIKRGFPKDLPVRPAHSLQLDWWVTQRNFINIWMPEGVIPAYQRGRRLTLTGQVAVDMSEGLRV